MTRSPPQGGNGAKRSGNLLDHLVVIEMGKQLHFNAVVAADEGSRDGRATTFTKAAPSDLERFFRIRVKPTE